MPKSERIKSDSGHEHCPYPDCDFTVKQSEGKEILRSKFRTHRVMKHHE